VILLDTNVISEFMKKPANPAVLSWYLLHDEQTALPAPAIGEIAFGLTKMPFGKRRSNLENDLMELRLHYAKRTLPFTGVTAMIYGDIMAEALSAKHNMSVADGQIAAIAAEHDCVLATRNIRDFKHISLALVNPWES
jgi:toxin FitB